MSQAPAVLPAPRARRLLAHGRGCAGWLLLAALAFLVGLDVWVRLGAFEPLLRDGRVEHIFLSRSPLLLAAACALAFGVLASAHLAVTALADGRRPGLRLEAREAAWLAPLFLLAFGPLALLNFVPPFAGSLGPWVYLGIDLRPWITLLAVALVARELDRRTGGRLRARASAMAASLRPRAPVAAEAGLAALVAGFAILSSPDARFSGALHGDEPKYFRYCENWYQGQGFDLRGRQDLDQLPADYVPPLLDNFRALAAAIPDEIGSMRRDLADLARGRFDRRFNQARAFPGWFIEGKTGGVYQVHTPGISFLMFPAYFLDRHFLNWDHRAHPHFPAELRLTSTFFLLLYALYAVVVFRFLSAYAGSTAAGAGLALLFALTLPIANFPFQYYPEIAAGLTVFLVAHYLLFVEKSRLAAAAAAGVAAGFLPWLHIRFLLVSAVLIVWTLAAERRRARLAAAFAIGWAIPLAVFAFYSYHLTGSILPTAMYRAEGAVHIVRMEKIGPGFFAYLFDRDYGMLAHTPVLLLALPGVLLAFRRRPAAAALAALLVLAVAAPGAAHGFAAAGATPGRYLVAAMPFAGLGLIEAFRRFGGRPLFQAAFAVLLILSLQTSWAYNRHHRKEVGPILESGVSGWRLNLAFPGPLDGSYWGDPALRSWLVPIWAAMAAGLVLLPVAADRRTGGPGSPGPAPAVRRRRLDALAIATLAGVGLAGSALTAIGGTPTAPRSVAPPGAAAAGLRQFLFEHDCWLCLSSARGSVGRRAVLASPFRHFSVSAAPAEPRPGEPVRLRLQVSGEWGEPAAGLASIDFGDGAAEGGVRVLGEYTTTHAYGAPGRYDVAVYVADETHSERRNVAIDVGGAREDPRADPFDPAAAAGLPSWAGQASATSELETIAVGEDRLCVEHTARAVWPVRGGRQAEVWLFARERPGWRGRPLGWIGAGEACVPLDGVRVPGPNQRVAVMLLTASGEAGAPARSRIEAFDWPAPVLVAGAPVVLTPRAGETEAITKTR